MLILQKNNIIIVSGVGFRANPKNTDKNIFENNKIKPNIGATCCFELAKAGYHVLMLSRTEEKLKYVKESIIDKVPNANISFESVDLLDKEAIQKVISKIPEHYSVNLVHCAGLSAGSYQLPDDNPYLEIERTPEELPSLEFEVVVKSLLILVKTLLPRFEKQGETKIIVNSSMSGIRSYLCGYSHTSAKAGLHHAVRSMTLELNKRNIFITEINPGIVDTGLYDSVDVQKSVGRVAESYGYNYKKIPKMEPKEVAKAVLFALKSKAHVLTLNIIPKGQWPHTGS